MREALRLAKRAKGETSPNPMVGAVLVSDGSIIGRGWHRCAGLEHAEVNAISNAHQQGHSTRDSTMYVTLEPCSTAGRTPPCTKAILDAGISRVVFSATDPNPRHAGRAFRLLKNKGVEVECGILADLSAELNAAFNHWIITGLPFVTVKAAMTLDGKIASVNGESKWITGSLARREGMKLRHEVDAILVGVKTILNDDPALTLRDVRRPKPEWRGPDLKRIVLDPRARTPLDSKILNDEGASTTIIIVSPNASVTRLKRLEKKCAVMSCPLKKGKFDLKYLLKKLGKQNITNLLVEGGGETNAAFIESGFVNRITFFYAPKILGGRDARTGVAGEGLPLKPGFFLERIRWRNLGSDLMLTARVIRK